MVICSDLGILLSPRNKGILRQVQAWMSQQTSYGAKGARHTQKVHAVCEVKQRAIALCAERSEWVTCVDSRFGRLSVNGHKENS